MDRFERERGLTTGASMGADVESASFNVQKMADFTLQFVWSAGSTPIGTIAVQYSNDGTNWDTDPDSEVAISGNSGSETIIAPGGPKFARAYYTRSSGDGTLDITLVQRGWY